MTYPRVFYLNKQDNLPFYCAGKELHTVEYNRGWVEYLSQSSDIYFTYLNQNLFQKFHQNPTQWIAAAWADQNLGHLSLLKQLCNTRLEKKFDLPLFADYNNECTTITCGNTRFTAEVLCGTEPDQIPVFFQTVKNHHFSELDQAFRITSTEQAEILVGIDKLDYKISFLQSDQPCVINSVLRNTIYDSNSEYETFASDGQFIVDFWNKYVIDDKINLTITCDPDTVKFVEFDPKIWNVKYNLQKMHGFSFSDILNEFHHSTTNGLNLYVYDIKNKFNLLYLLPWTSSNSVWYHTLNQKVNLFDTSRGPATACWPIVSMGNFVK